MQELRAINAAPPRGVTALLADTIHQAILFDG